MRNKSLDLEKIAMNLDISPSMYQYAVDRYTGIAKYLESKGIKAEFYPQGSFRTGTVTRPMKDGVECDFDIDVVCVLIYDKKQYSAKQVKAIVGDALKADETYRKKLEPEEDRCWTLKYADLSDTVGLKLDVVPAVKEDINQIVRLLTASVDSKYAMQAIAITDRKEGRYNWLSSNPSGFGDWFDDINKKYLEMDIIEKKKQFFTENRGLFRADAKIEDVPDYYVRSSLQRVIQLLKRHRDLFFYRNGSKYRPASVIITSLAAKIAAEITPRNIEELLQYVVNGLGDYRVLLEGKRPEARYYGEKREYVQIRNSKWWIPNPVDPDDNYADSWTDETAQAFFDWVDVVKMDLGDTTSLNETRYLTGLQTSFGKEKVNSVLHLASVQPVTYSRPSTISRPTKPWGDK